MKRTILVAGALAAGMTAVMAQATQVIEQRQNLMKQNNAATRTMAGMLRGQAPFDLNQVQSALRTYEQVGQQFHTLFPEDSKSGNNTRALPAIWQNKADFTAQSMKLAQDARAAGAAIRDEATFKAEMPKVLENCNACHNKYRAQT